MAFDFTKLEGYKPEMTADEKLALLDKYEAPKADYAGYIKKDLFDKTASDLAEAKRQLKAKLTEDEQKEVERQAAEQAIKEELEALRKDKTLSETKSQFLALGYDEKLAHETAEAVVNGEVAKVFANQKLFIENVRKAERASALADTTKNPPAGGSGGSMTKKEFENLGYSERLKLLKDNPETYKQLTEETN